MKYKIKLQGLDCANCANKIEQRVNNIKDVITARLNFSNSTLVVETNINEFNIIFDQIKYIVNELEPDVHVYLEHTHNHQCDCTHHNHSHHHSNCACDHAHIKSDLFELQKSIKFNIYNLDCASCASKLEKQLLKLSYINQININFSTGKLQVVLNQNIDNKDLKIQLQKTIDEIEPGVKIELISTLQQTKYSNLFNLKKNKLLIVGFLLCIMSNFFANIYYRNSLLFIAYICIGGRVLYKAFKNIKHGQIFDENFLMSIATLGAMLIGEYYEAVAVMLFYKIGEIFQSYAVNKSRKSISQLMDIKEDVATILKDNQELILPIEEVKVKDIMIVRPGQRVALDGIVIEGQSMLDASALTGESMPCDIKKGDNILSGVINLTSVIKVEVSTTASQSTVSRILDLVENASTHKAPIEQFITKFAKIYTPIVCILSICVAILPVVLFNRDLHTWIYRALTFLVVSCPCALVISIPLALFAGIGGISKQGVLIKGGSDLERLKDVDTIVLDKTGTLTKGKFSVVDVIGNQQQEIVKLAAFAEFYSNHPIAKSIVDYYGQPIDTQCICAYQEIAGKGISVEIENNHILLGNASFMIENNIQFEKCSAIGTVVYLAKNKEYLGCMVIADQIKESSYKGLAQLRKIGISKIVMLTGDDSKVAQDVATKLGIDEYYSNLLPQNKVEIVEKLLQQPHRQLAFIGDGINDAPVLARSDLGVAMGQIGSDIAIEAADIVLMNDDLTIFAKAILAAKRTGKIMYQNIYFSLAVKIGVLILTTFGFSNMWMGVFADVGVTLIAIFNSMRTMKIK